MWFQFSKENVLLQLFFLNFFIHFGNFVSLDTGYKNDKGILKQNYNKDDIRLLKCTYLFAGKNHLQFTKLLLEHHLCDIKAIISLIFNGNQFVKKQIASLYYSKEVEVGSLWLLNMYTCIVGRYLDYFINDKINGKMTKENFSKIAEILKCHEYVYRKLDLESKDCDTKSRFYIDNIGFDDNHESDYIYILKFILKNKDDIEKLIDKNNNSGSLMIGNFKVFGRFYLYLKRFGHYESVVLKLINSFNLKIHWGDITMNFKNVYDNANKFDWPSTNLCSCLLFYSMVFDFFKLIMLRLTWKQFLYIERQGASLIVNLTDQWLITLNGFAKYLALENDYIIKSVIDSLSVHIKNYPSKDDGTIDLNKIPTYQMQYTDQLINNISNIILKLCEGLGCTIVKNWNKEEILQTSNQINFYLGCDEARISKIFNEITDTWKNKYLNETIDFGEYLNYLFKDVNFNVIRSFIDYIETLNSYSLFDGESLINFDTI